MSMTAQEILNEYINNAAVLAAQEKQIKAELDANKKRIADLMKILGSTAAETPTGHTAKISIRKNDGFKKADFKRDYAELYESYCKPSTSNVLYIK